MVKGGAADRAGLEDDDIVVEVNGVNVEQSSHEDVVAMIRSSGSSLEMLVAKKSVYDQLKYKGVSVTRLLLGDTSYADVSAADRPEARREQEARPATPTETDRARVSAAGPQDFTISATWNYSTLRHNCHTRVSGDTL